MNRDAKLNRKRTGLPGGKIPKSNRRTGKIKFSGAARTDGLTNLPAWLQRRFF